MGTTNLTGTPAFLGTSSVSYSARDVRRFIQSAPLIFTAGGEGVVESGDFAVAQRGAGANMSVDVAAGEAYVKGDTSADEGSYYCRETTTLNVTVTGSDATNPRIDRVVLEVKNDSEDGGGLNLARIRTIDGTPTVGATLANLTGAASVPNTCFLLANVLVPAGSTTVTTANIQNRRHGVPLPGRELFGGSASLTTSTSPAGDIVSVTVIGDGVTPVIISASGQSMMSSAAAGTSVNTAIYDAASRGGTMITRVAVTSPGANYELPGAIPFVRVAAFSGSKSYFWSVAASAGTASFNAAATYPSQMTAQWAG
jgi:hypothetical protein